jgi:hypothetical protein
VVPLATIGSHYTMLMAPGGATLARLLRLKRYFRNERLPLPMHLLPPPVRITSELLPPLDLERAAPAASGERERIERAHQLVHGTLVEAVAAMRHDRPYWASQVVPARRGRYHPSVGDLFPLAGGFGGGTFRTGGVGVR